MQLSGSLDMAPKSLKIMNLQTQELSDVAVHDHAVNY